MNPFFDDKVRSRALPGLKLAETLYPAGLAMPRHEHEAARFSLVLRGGYRERYGRRVRACAPAMLVLHPPGEDHAVQFDDCETSIFDVQLGAGWLEHIREYTNVLEDAREFTGGRAAQLAVRLYSELREEDEASALTIEGLVLEILGAACRTDDARPRPSRRLESAREILHARHAESLTLTDLTAAIDAHPVYLAREFRRAYGCTMGEYVRRLRVESACRALSGSVTPLAELATSLGFYDQSHFTRVFKRITGMTPSAYRVMFRQS
ncbi:MAG TPA: AraC family transcriptional regulator [Pyrinomonadaceae bacterium]|jgi:AraC family transcriptional regulator